MPLRLVFMGTPDFGVPTLDYLAQQALTIVGVVTQPDRPQGRGYASLPSAVKQAALRLGLPCLQPERVNTPEFLEQLSAWQPDVIVVAAFGQILKQPLLDLPPLGCINLHASLLPKYRGASPVQWAIADGERETGITVQKMALTVDSGDILVQSKVAIGPVENAGQVFEKLSALGGPAIMQALAQRNDLGGLAGVPQEHSLATFAPKLSRQDGQIDWQWRADKIHNRVRGFFPWPGAFTQVGDQVLKLIRTQVAEPLSASVAVGTILESRSDTGWRVAAGEGTSLQVLEIQGANTKRMTAHAYTCGHRVGEGTVLGTRRESHGSETHHHRG